MSDNGLSLSKNKQEQVFQTQQDQQLQLPEELYGNTYFEKKRDF